MTDTPEMKLAKALRLAADEYCRETGRVFEASFDFIDVTSVHDERPKHYASVVTVRHTEETRA